jgi:DNA mismatch repair ATPase MutL
MSNKAHNQARRRIIWIANKKAHNKVSAISRSKNKTDGYPSQMVGYVSYPIPLSQGLIYSEKQQPEPSKQQKADEKQQQKEQKDAQKQSKESEKQNRDAEKAQKDNRPTPSGSKQTGRDQSSAEESHGQGQRIPPQKFQASFGRGHHFRVRHLDDRHRFQYGGYWFEVSQPWPAGWSYDDDCYIEDDGGAYYLVDLIHPDFRVLVIVVEV